MNLIKLKKNFLNELKEIYPAGEIESFFYLLTSHYINKGRLDVALQPEFNMQRSVKTRFEQALVQLKKEYPIQYIIGSTDFMGLRFEINESVLIPRPETEELVSWIISLNHHKKALEVLDIGTGSGCIPVSLAKDLEDARIDAIDLSEKALLVAKKNAALNKVDINFIQDDILGIEHLKKAYDLIISNPPYVRESEKVSMHNNVLKYEPGMALFVDDDNPLVFYKHIGKLARVALKNRGELFFEINQYLADPLKELLRSYGFVNVEVKKDVYGADRMIRAVKN